ncbi:MAG: undecaprenyl-diphosphatase UppP [Chloroflexi bacterium]|nr:undecaprenyl-diphosphatase UppP [Chloroflexota bacterium]
MIEDLLKAALLGVVQGLTEFLPVSSTGHLILTEKALGIDQDRYGLSFDAALHLGTLLALLAFFGMTWVRLAMGGLRTITTRSLADPEGRLAWLIVLGTIPAGVLGFLLEKKIEDAFRSPLLVAAMLIAFGAVFLAAEAAGRRRRDMSTLTWVDSLIVGCAQAVALVPGVSRSGATICAGLFRDMERREAATFAFLLSAPIIAGAGLKQLLKVIGEFTDGTLGGDDFAFFATGFVCAAVVGYLSIKFLLGFLATNTLVPFVYYRVAVGLAVIAVVAVQSLA